MRVVVLDITQDKGPIIHCITGIQEVSVPELSFSLSGKFLAITLEPEWNGDEDSTGPGLAFVLEAAKPTGSRWTLNSGRTVLWSSADIFAPVSQRTVLSVQDGVLCRIPAITANTDYTDPDNDDLGSGSGMEPDFGYGCDSDEDEEIDALRSKLIRQAHQFGQSHRVGRPHKRTLDKGSISPCGSLVIALVCTSAKTQVEHWQIGGPELSCTADIVQPLTLPSQMYVNDGFSVAWHPTLQSRLIYALAVERMVLLIDGQKHRVIRSWSQLGSLGRFLRGRGHDAMSWSPDGTRLAVLTARKRLFVFQADVI